jgi:hypothetical protein
MIGGRADLPRRKWFCVYLGGVGALRGPRIRLFVAPVRSAT